VIGRLRVLLRTDSVICLVGGGALTVFARSVADALDLDRAVGVRSVGLFLVGYGVILAVLARATPRSVEVAGRLTALADASWVIATVALVGAGTFSFRGNIIVAIAAIPVAALGVGKVLALRELDTHSSPRAGRNESDSSYAAAGYDPSKDGTLHARERW
jgi:hypothetical protein